MLDKWAKILIGNCAISSLNSSTKNFPTALKAGRMLVGFYEGKKLKFCGKVGTGFNEKLLGSLHARFREISRKGCPFVNLPETRGSHFKTFEKKTSETLQPA